MDFINLLSSFGFPVVACIALAWYCKDISDKNREDVKELNKQHIEEMLVFKDEIKEALNNNTMAINRLCDNILKGGEV